MKCNQNELYHHGILGMKWGIRRTPQQLGHRTRRNGLDASMKKATDPPFEIRNSERKALNQLFKKYYDPNDDAFAWDHFHQRIQDYATEHKNEYTDEERRQALIDAELHCDAIDSLNKGLYERNNDSVPQSVYFKLLKEGHYPALRIPYGESTMEFFEQLDKGLLVRREYPERYQQFKEYVASNSGIDYDYAMKVMAEHDKKADKAHDEWVEKMNKKRSKETKTKKGLKGLFKHSIGTDIYLARQNILNKNYSIR